MTIHVVDLTITRKQEAVMNDLKIHDAAISGHFLLNCNVDLPKPSSVKSKIKYRKLSKDQSFVKTFLTLN